MLRDLRLCLHILVSSPYVQFRQYGLFSVLSCVTSHSILVRGELSYLAPLGSENISAPYFKQCFFQGGRGITPQTVKHHASQSQDRNNKYFILYVEFCINNKI